LNVEVVFDGFVTVDVGVLGRGLLGERHELGVRHRDQCGRVVGSGEQAEVDWVVVEHLGHFAEVSNDDTKRWRHDAEGLFDGHRRDGRVHAAADAASAGADVDGIARVAALQDDLVATEQHGLAVGVDGFTVLEVEGRVHGESTSDTGDRVDAPFLQPRRSRARTRFVGVVLPDGLGVDAVRVGDAIANLGLAVGTNVDWQVRECHGST